MVTYTAPIVSASIVFVILAIFLFVPWLIYTYRKYGYLTISTMIVTFSFIFYFLSALFLVLLPLPATRDTCSMQPPDTAYYSLVPFTFVKNTFENSGIVFSQPSTYALILKQPSFFQALFNFLLLLPFGVYLRYFLQSKRYWKKAFVYGFALTLFYEITQVTGIYGIYNCPYRIFDVDDLLLNSTGALVGFFLAPIALSIFPSKQSVQQKAIQLAALDETRPLTQLFAILVDVLLIKVSWSFTFGLFITNGVLEFLYKSVLLFAIFFVLPTIWSGNTIGTRFMRFRIVSNGRKNKSMFKRFVAIYVTYFVYSVFDTLNKVNLDIDSPYYVFKVSISLGSFMIMVGITLMLIIHILIVVLSKGKRRFYFDEVADVYATKK
ncbi:VanZ family protein [Psychrobacillus sp.]|uniref:VanZ family protein n=1 Tax=Psychrobacillus sp. TaxID=1871623 RepID=UPI0028BEF11D|nr:VanZ family protein [Psychrobacillus sp.]